MGHRVSSITTPLRRYLWPKLHPHLSDHGGYAVGPTQPEEYVATIPMHVQEVTYLLIHHLGFQPNPVAAKKYRGEQPGDEWANGSFARRVIEEPGDGPEWLPDSLHTSLSGWMAGMQLHVTLYSSEDEDGLPVTGVFAHWEYNWITHPVKHKWPDRGGYISAEDGVEMMQTLLDEAEVEYYQE